jgi:hypothetical protein
MDVLVTIYSEDVSLVLCVMNIDTTTTFQDILDRANKCTVVVFKRCYLEKLQYIYNGTAHYIIVADLVFDPVKNDLSKIVTKNIKKHSGDIIMRETITVHTVVSHKNNRYNAIFLLEKYADFISQLRCLEQICFIQLVGKSIIGYIDFTSNILTLVDHADEICYSKGICATLSYDSTRIDKIYKIVWKKFIQ